jgi:hypothetical protein
MKIPFVGSTHELRAWNADVQRSVNVFPVLIESGTGKNVSMLKDIPGLTIFASIGAECRGGFATKGRMFMVAGNGFYEVLANGTFTLKGALSTYTGAVDIKENRTQIIITDGNGYVFNLESGVFSKIADDAFLGSIGVAVVEGVAVFTQTNTDTFFVSKPDDATLYDALDFEVATSNPDGIVRPMEDHGQLFLFGKKGTELWDYTGASVDFSFTRNSGAKIQVGLTAAFSACKLDNTIYWLGENEYGAPSVWRLAGYTPVRVSTHAEEEILQAATSIEGATAYAYQQDGHSFYCLNVPGINKTLCYEASSGSWHLRAELVDGEFTQHRGRCHVFAFGKHFLGAANGAIYQLDPTKSNNAGDVLCRERVSPHTSAPLLEKTEVNGFQVDCNVGTGLDGGHAAQLMIRYSKTGGKTWNSWRYASLGVVGRYNAKAKILRCGKSRDWVWQVRCTDDVPLNITGAIVT